MSAVFSHLIWIPIVLVVALVLMFWCGVIEFVWAVVTEEHLLWTRNQREIDRELESLRHRDLGRITLNALPQATLRERDAQRAAFDQRRIDEERRRMNLVMENSSRRTH